MHPYGVRDVEKLLRLPRTTIRALIDAGFVSPARGPRNALLFSFQDLVVLRTAQALASANVPQRRITTSLKKLRSRLPETMPLSGLSISAVGDRVVVKEGRTQWSADSGQYLLAFEGNPLDGTLSVIARAEEEKAPDGTDWFDRGVTLEREDPKAAIEAYEHAIELDPSCIDAYLNLGSLLHESGRLIKAERVYRQMLDVNGSDPLVLFNLGVLLEDLGRSHEAIEAYEAALRLDPNMADCHYNLALLCEALEKRREAIQHMARYRRLTAK